MTRVVVYSLMLGVGVLVFVLSMRRALRMQRYQQSDLFRDPPEP